MGFGIDWRNQNNDNHSEQSRAEQSRAEQSRAEQSRILWVDILRGIGIILMVFGHVHSSQDGIRSFIYAFHMPLFFIVSGYLYRKPKDLKKYVLKKLKSFLIPYFSFGMIYYLLWMSNNFYSEENLMKPLIALTLKSVSGLPIETALWFLPALLFIELCYAMMDIHIDSKSRIVIIGILSLVGCLWTSIIPFRLPWALDVSMAAIGFFYIGSLIRSSESFFFANIMQERHKLLVLLVALIDGVAICLNGTLNMRTGSWGCILISYFNALVFTWVLYQFSLWIEKEDTIITDFFSRIGANSIVFLCTNHLVIRFVAKSLSILNEILGIRLKGIDEIIVTFISIFCIMMIVEVWNKAKRKYLPIKQ